MHLCSFLTHSHLTTFPCPLFLPGLPVHPLLCRLSTLQESRRYLTLPSPLLANSSSLNPSLTDPSPYLIRRCLHSARKALSLQHTLDANGAARPEWRRKASEMMQREVDACLAALEAGKNGEGNALLQAILQDEGSSRGEGKGESEEQRGRLRAGESKDVKNPLSTIKR